jgi:hypothetical protein
LLNDPVKTLAIDPSHQPQSQLISPVTRSGWRDITKRLSTLNLVVLISLAARLLPAAEPSPDDAAEAVEQLKQFNDQTIIVSHVWLDTEWDQFKHGAEKATWTLGGVWGWRVSDQQDWAVRLKVPFLYDRSDASSGHAELGGVGDIEVATGTAFRLSNTWRTGGGIELHADTASNPALGGSVWRLHSLWAVAHDVTKWLTLAPTVEYSHSIAEENDLAPHRFLELSLPTTFILPYDWSIGTTYKAKIDFENGDRWTHTVDVGVAKRLPNVPVVLSATLEKPLNGGAKKLQVNLTMTYYFGK